MFVCFENELGKFERELDEKIEALRVLDLGYRVEALFVPDVDLSNFEDDRAVYD